MFDRWAIHPEAGRSSKRLATEPRGRWERTENTAARVIWTNEYKGIRLTLRRSSTDGLWRGRTEPFSDDGLAPPGTEISVRRISDAACELKP